MILMYGAPLVPLLSMFFMTVNIYKQANLYFCKQKKRVEPFSRQLTSSGQVGEEITLCYSMLHITSLVIPVDLVSHQKKFKS